jgi:hypothetical protein
MPEITLNLSSILLLDVTLLHPFLKNGKAPSSITSRDMINLIK